VLELILAGFNILWCT